MNSFKYLLAIDVGLEEARVVRVRGDFGFDERGGIVVAQNFRCDVSGEGFRGGDGGEQLVGSEHRNLVAGGH